MPQTALILGAGLGGLVATESSRELLPNPDGVIAVDRAGTSLNVLPIQARAS